MHNRTNPSKSLFSPKSDAGLTYVEVILAVAIAVVVSGALYLALSAGLSGASLAGDALGWANRLEAVERDLRMGAERVRIPFWIALPAFDDEGGEFDVPYVDGDPDSLLSLRWDDEHLVISAGSATFDHSVRVSSVDRLEVDGRWAGLVARVGEPGSEVEIIAAFGGWSLR